MIGRRGFITGLVSLVAAPAIVRAGSLMPIRTMLIEHGLRYRAISTGQAMDLLIFDRVVFDLSAEPPRFMGVIPDWVKRGWA